MGRKTIHFYGPYQGRMWSIREIADVANINPNSILTRLKLSNGILTEDIFRPITPKNKYYITDEDGEYMTLADFARKYDLEPRLVRDRYVYMKIRDVKKLKKLAYTL